MPRKFWFSHEQVQGVTSGAVVMMRMIRLRDDVVGIGESQMGKVVDTTTLQQWKDACLTVMVFDSQLCCAAAYSLCLEQH